MATIKTTFTCVGTNVSSINSISISPTAKSITVNDPESVGVTDMSHSSTFDILPIAKNASGTWAYVENAMTSGTDKVSIILSILTIIYNLQIYFFFISCIKISNGIGP